MAQCHKSHKGRRPASKHLGRTDVGRERVSRGQQQIATAHHGEHGCPAIEHDKGYVLKSQMFVHGCKGTHFFRYNSVYGLLEFTKCYQNKQKQNFLAEKGVQLRNKDYLIVVKEWE